MNKILLIGFIILLSSWSTPSVSRSNFYPVFKGESIASMENMVKQLDKSTDQKAYLGALKMKLSGLQEGISTKINTFKEGRELLENEIKNQPKNVEWRFLRLAIQEHAPKIVMYSNNTKADASFISTQFSSIPKDLQKIIKDYASTSPFLTVSEFQ